MAVVSHGVLLEFTYDPAHVIFLGLIILSMLMQFWMSYKLATTSLRFPFSIRVGLVAIIILALIVNCIFISITESTSTQNPVLYFLIYYIGSAEVTILTLMDIELFKIFSVLQVRVTRDMINLAQMVYLGLVFICLLGQHLNIPYLWSETPNWIVQVSFS